MVIEYKYVNGHVEVYDGNVFLFSTDTIEEAIREMSGGNYEN